MSAFPELLDDFHAAILTGDAAAAEASVKKNPRLAPQAQLAIYIDGYRIRLTGAIRADYPALLALIGDTVFDALALEYVETHPPIGFNLDRYPHKFAAFVGKYHDKFAAELAMLEGTISEVFMMEESHPLGATALAGLTMEAFAGLTLKARSASRLLAFDYPVNDWLAARRAGDSLPGQEKKATFLYVYRHQNSVQRVPLDKPAYMLLERLFAGLPVGEAIDVAEHGEAIVANLQAWFAEWMEKGFFRQ